jgi:2-oxoglutarate ferredoxin oxidoreductase subunit alpha
MPWKRVAAELPPGDHYFSGSEAIAEGAIAAGCRYYAGYPITPTTETLERIADRFGEIGGTFIQMEDEIGSLASCIGASWAGAKAMTVTSGPGFSLMQEGIGYAIMTETPVVLVNAQRAGPSTGQILVGSGDIMQARWGNHGGISGIAISPWSVQELYDQCIRCFSLAERYRVPVMLMAEATTAHLRERMSVASEIEVFDREKNPGAPPFGTEEDDGVPPMPAFGEGEKLLVTGSTHDAYGVRKASDAVAHQTLATRLYNKVMKHTEEIVEHESYYMDDAEVAVVCYGFTARSSLFAVQQLRKEGRKVGMLRLKTLWPFADRVVADVGAQVKRVFVPEMNLGQVIGEVVKYVDCDIVPYNQMNGQVIEPGTILEQLRRLPW